MMFWSLFKYRVIRMFRMGEETFWTFLFPIILATFFYLGFGNIMNGGVSYTPPQVAVVVEEGQSAMWFGEMIADNEELSSLMEIRETSRKEADELFEQGEVEAIIVADDSLSMEVKKSGTTQTVLKVFLDTCLRYEAIMMDMVKENPAQAAAFLQREMEMPFEMEEYTKEGKLTDANLSAMAQYFYSLIAMGCLYGCFSGLSCVQSIQANVSALGARRSVASAHRMKVIVADFLGTVLVQFLASVVLLIYLCGILRMEIGTRYGLMLLVCFAGNLIGIANGILVGSFGNLKEGVKNAILIGGTMILCFLSGLMVHLMKAWIDSFCPFLNKINPATVITDCFYALNVSTTYERYMTGLGTLVGMAVLLLIISYFRLRRDKFASL